jgi:ABC-type sugar transport system ATPase subunit
MELLAASGIRKYYRDTLTLANDGVSLGLSEGETRAVVGENGAGKSTLARILAGLVTQDSGEVRVRGKILRPGSVHEAEAAGIGFVPQFSLLAEDLTVAENLVLGREPRSLGLFVSRRKAYVETAMLVERFGFRLDPDALVSNLTAAERRQAEIARALARGGEILILDEPTSILSESESSKLFELLSRLSKAGKAVLLITHRLSEVLKVADSITVLRDGRVIAEVPAEGADETELRGRSRARDSRLEAGGGREADQPLRLAWRSPRGDRPRRQRLGPARGLRLGVAYPGGGGSARRRGESALDPEGETQVRTPGLRARRSRTEGTLPARLDARQSARLAQARIP